MKTETYDSIIDGLIECLMLLFHCILWIVIVGVILCIISFGLYLVFDLWEFSWLWPFLLAIVVSPPFTIWSYAQRRARLKFGIEVPRDFWAAWGHGVEIKRDDNDSKKDQQIISEMEVWINENNLGLHRIKIFDKFYRAVFWNKQDAVSFKIRWQR